MRSLRSRTPRATRRRTARVASPRVNPTSRASAEKSIGIHTVSVPAERARKVTKTRYSSCPSSRAAASLLFGAMAHSSIRRRRDSSPVEFLGAQRGDTVQRFAPTGTSVRERLSGQECAALKAVGWLSKVATAALLATACARHDPKSLDRTSVAALLTRYAQERPVMMTASVDGRLPGDRESAPKSRIIDNVAEPETKALLAPRLVARRYRPDAFGDFDAKYELTKEGQVASSSWKHVAGGTYDIPVGTLAIGDVTGIIKGGEAAEITGTTQAEVDFGCSIVPNTFGRELPQGHELHVTTPFSQHQGASYTMTAQSCQATLILYDDGWRVAAQS